MICSVGSREMFGAHVIVTTIRLVLVSLPMSDVQPQRYCVFQLMAKALPVYARQMTKHYHCIVLFPMLGYKELALKNMTLNRSNHASFSNYLSTNVSEYRFQRSI
jgi:hypothetical protein